MNHHHHRNSKAFQTLDRRHNSVRTSIFRSSYSVILWIHWLKILPLVHPFSKVSYASIEGHSSKTRELCQVKAFFLEQDVAISANIIINFQGLNCMYKNKAINELVLSFIWKWLLNYRKKLISPAFTTTRAHDYIDYVVEQTDNPLI